MYLAIGILIFFGMNNYLGLRTAGTFSMFSNLRTEGQVSNHLIFSQNQLKIWDFQDDIIHILDIDRRYGRERGSLQDYGLPLVEFQKKVLEWKEAGHPIPIIFFYQRKPYRYRDITQAEQWVLKEKQLRHYVMDFRKIQMDRKPNRYRW